MTVILLFMRNFFAFIFLIAVIFGLYKFGQCIVRFIKKRAEYYDVEKLDEAEILERKYNKKRK